MADSESESDSDSDSEAEASDILLPSSAQHGVHSHWVSGLVKTKKPGVVVFEGEQTAIKSFLENAKGLRYLDFHHLDTKPLLINSNNKIRLANSKLGLHEVENMNELVKTLDAIGEKEWFRQQSKMGMKR